MTLSAFGLELRPLTPAVAGDNFDRWRNYVLSTWVRSALETVRTSRLTHGPTVPTGIHDVATELLQQVHVAVRGDAVHGWIAGRKGALYWVYVPHKLQRRGLAKDMIAKVCGINITAP